MDSTTATLIQNLQTRVSQLENARSAPGEQLQPSYLTVSPDGTVGADFTGTVQARGVSINTSGSTVGAENAIIWDANGTEVGDVFGAWGAPDYAGVNVDGYAGSLVTLAQVALQAHSVGALAALFVRSWNDPGAQQAIQALIQPEGALPDVQRTIIDNGGNSDFLQLASTGNHKIAFGTGAITIPAGSATAKGTIAHGLPAAPALWTATPVDFNGDIHQGSPSGATNIYPQITTINIPNAPGTVTSYTAGGTFHINWIAIS